MADITQSYVQEFCLHSTIQKFKDALSQGSLCDALKQHWRAYVPYVYTCSNSKDNSTERQERRAHKLLFNPMEVFLCGGEPEGVFKQLQDKSKPAQLCGKVFKSGEPTYSCRDCATDATCVLCIDCFQQSSHRKHRYKMSSSGGGGYCDCGDHEAWSVDPCCDVHRQVTDDASLQDPMNTLPEDMQIRARALLSCCIQYSLDTLLCNELPADVRPHTMDNQYICMLYNDEVHTYEEVIKTLQKAVGCTHKEALDYATIVDREGKACVRVGPFRDCEEARKIIEENTSRQGHKPLRVQVMHSSLVAHQMFAQKILPWLQKIISYSDGLRHILCMLSLEKNQEGKMSILEQVMLADTKLWKSSRVQSHQLFMAGVLKDPEYKKEFAVTFALLFRLLFSNYIEDDHEFSVSVVSEAVQIFTVPTVARMLIRDHHILKNIIEAFMKECQDKKKNGMYCFGKNERNLQLKRAMYIFYDLKYLLTVIPTQQEWEADHNKLIDGFLEGYQCFLTFLKNMQGMDSVKRQVGQHLEFEPEWETAFDFQLTMEDCIVLFQRWCGSHRDVLIKAFDVTLSVLISKGPLGEWCDMEQVSVLGHTVNCIKYNVATKGVSIHAPVTRLLAGLYTLLEKYELVSEFSNQFGTTEASPVLLMEPSLQVQVLVSQVHANMWRRNGFSLVKQIIYYHNVKFRTEMFDKDITMLQIAASLLDGNEFIIHLLNRFQLLPWISEKQVSSSHQDEQNRQTATITEEFLLLLIRILGERYEPGVGMVTKQDQVKHETIHQLCIHPMSHSDLSKSLHENVNHETGLEDVVQDVAHFKKISGKTVKAYELKPEYYKQFNPYFYHYVKSEQSKAEEAQRKRKKQENEDQALVPPVPVEFSKTFHHVVHLLDCDVMIAIMKKVISLMGGSYHMSETQFDKILHLIGLALYEEERANQNGGNVFQFIKKATIGGSSSIYSMLESLVGHANISSEPQKDLLIWVVKLFRKVKSDEEHSCTELPKVDQESVEKERRRKEQAETRRARIMNQMSKMQKKFISENVELFEETSTDQSGASLMEISLVDGDVAQHVAIGSKQCVPSNIAPHKETCILCQEEQEISHKGRALVLSAYIQRSAVLSKSRGKTVENMDEYDPLFMSPDLFQGAYTTTCGHCMHAECWQRYFDSVVARARRRPFQFQNNMSYNLSKHEYLCPLCETISNTVLPLIPALRLLTTPRERTTALTKIIPQFAQNTIFSATDEQPQTTQREPATTATLGISEWLDAMQKTVVASMKKSDSSDDDDEDDLLLEPCPFPSLAKMLTVSAAQNLQLLFDYVLDDGSGNFSESNSQMIRKFSTDVYTVSLDVLVNPDDMRFPIPTWTNAAYNIQVMEQILRASDKPLFGSLQSRQMDCLKALVRVAAVSAQVNGTDSIKQLCIKLLSALVLQDKKSMRGVPNIIEMDMFYELVQLSMTLPVLFFEGQWPTVNNVPTGGTNDLHILRLTLTAHVVQIMFTMDFHHLQGESMETDDTEDEKLLRIFRDIRLKAGLNKLPEIASWQLNSHVTGACIPFLRCAALLFYIITDVSPPQSLQEGHANEYESLCEYLCMPTTLSSLFDQAGDNYKSLIYSWCEYPSVKVLLSSEAHLLNIQYPLQPNHLISLPHDYSDLLRLVATFKCPQSEGDETRSPTMCLVCGKLLCSRTYCCQVQLDDKTVGAVTAHAQSCGAGTGVFLRIRECQILLLTNVTKGCFYPPPYLDAYGETDQKLRRGNPLYLSADRYKDLNKMWFHHGVAEEISHRLEYNNSYFTFEWQQF